MSSKRWGWMLGLLTAGAVLLAGCGQATGAGERLFGSDRVSAAGVEETTLRTVSVTGSGRASAAPDVAYITLGVESRDVDAAAAVADNTARMQAVMAALEALGLTEADVRTVNYSMWLEQGTKPDPTPRPLPETMPAQPGAQGSTAQDAEEGVERFHVLNQVRVTLRDLTITGDVLGAALDAGANSVAGISFGVEDTTALREQAREQAIADAEARAEQLAAGLGASLGQVHSINEYGGGGVVTEAAVRDVYALGGGSVPVSGGELAVSVEIQVTFLLN